MKILYLMIIVVLLSGCEFIAPDTSKALSEIKQVELNERQIMVLERIATALEIRNKEDK